MGCRRLAVTGRFLVGLACLAATAAQAQDLPTLTEFVDVYGTTVAAIPATLEALPAGTSVLPATLVGIDSITLYYRGPRGMAAEVFFFRPDGKVLASASCCFWETSHSMRQQRSVQSSATEVLRGM